MPKITKHGAIGGYPLVIARVEPNSDGEDAVVVHNETAYTDNETRPFIQYLKALDDAGGFTEAKDVS